MEYKSIVMPARTIKGLPSFNAFILEGKGNRKYLSIALPALLVQLVIFKIFYPFASFFFTDSFGYLYAAASNLDAHIWPIGYSKFLRLFNTFFHSDTALVCFQYLFLQACGLCFFFTLLYLFRPSKTVSIILFVFLIFNPLFLYLGNSISSDSLFIGLSFLWIGQLMRMIGHPSRQSLVIHGILLALLFTIRYTAIYYPLVSVPVILLSANKPKEKLIAITIPLFLVAGFIYYTGNAIKEMAGVRKFSPFGGWQLANNALYMYSHIGAPETASGHTPARLAELNRRIHRYFDSAKKERTLFDSAFPGIYFLWSQQSPLAVYAGLQRKKDSAANYFKAWAAVSPLYEDYGAWYIKQHPLAFVQYFCFPNAVRYALPPLEFMGRYNSGMDTVDQLARYWFHYRDQRVRAFSKNFQSYILAPYPPLSLVLHLFFLGALAIFLTTKGISKADPVFLRQLSLITALWGLHFGFSIFAAPVVLRYQVFPMILCGSFSLLLAERLLRWEKMNKEIKTDSDEQKKNNRRGLRFFPGLSIRLRRHRQTIPFPAVQVPAGIVSLDPSHGGSDSSESSSY